MPDAIRWHEGMMLAPQHFQQLSLRHEELLNYHISRIAPFCWGVQRLSIDQAILIQGMFRVTELEAIMPDGLAVRYGADHENNLDIDLSAYDEEMRHGQIIIYLAVPAKKSDRASRGVLQRFYSVEGEPVLDEDTGEEIPIPRLIPRLSLFAAEAPPRKYCAIPIAAVGYKDETISMGGYIHPMLNVALHSPLGMMCGALSRRLREKAVFLAERLHSPSSAIRGAMVLETKLLLRSIVSALPQFEAVLNTGNSHPFLLYMALCGLVGNMASLGAGLVPPILSSYNHNDLRRSFQEAIDYLYRMISEAILESHTPICFELNRGVFSLMLEREWMDNVLIIGVKAKPGVSESYMTAWMNDSLIGSAEVMESMKERRILGAKRKKIEAEGELVPLRGTTLFSIEAVPSDTSERFIYPDQTLQIINSVEMSQAHQPAEIILYVKNE
jgi:type VI secretion system protein ImpJ